MAVKKVSSLKKISRTKLVNKKSAKTKSILYGGLSRIRLLVFSVVFAVFGSVIIYFANAAPLTWGQLASNYNCSLNVYGVPPTLYPGEVRGCARMLKYVLRTYMGFPSITDDSTTYGQAAVNAVKTTQTYFKINPNNGVVGLETWALVQNFYLSKTGQLPSAPTSPTPPPNAYIGPKPGFSGKLTQNDVNFFNAQWPKWNTVGWCIIGHESHTAGEYKTANGDGAFQIIKSTWAGYYGYPNASSAPPDVQWVKFLRLYADGAGGSHWHGTYWANSSGHLVNAQGADLGSHDYRPGAIRCPNT